MIRRDRGAMKVATEFSRTAIPRVGERAPFPFSEPAPDDPGSFMLGSGAARPAFADLFEQIINGLPEQIALLNEDWDILVVNEAWTHAVEQYGYQDLLPGTNYLRFCEARAAEGHSPAALC